MVIRRIFQLVEKYAKGLPHFVKFVDGSLAFGTPDCLRLEEKGYKALVCHGNLGHAEHHCPCIYPATNLI